MHSHEQCESDRLPSRTTRPAGHRIDGTYSASSMDTPARMAELQRAAGNRAVSGAIVQRRATTGRTVQRLKEAASPFAGWAGTADARAGEAAAQAPGFQTLHVDTAYATAQAARKEEQLDSFRHADIPFVSDNQNHYAYKKMIELRQDYLDDVARIDLAQGAYNDAVLPASLAAKSMARYGEIQRQLGFDNGPDAAADLSKREARVLGDKLDAKQLRTLNEKVANQQRLAQGKRTEILGTSHNIQAAMQKRAAVLSAEEKTKADEEKTKIQEKIKAVSEGAEKVAQVIEFVSFAAVGGPAAIGSVAEGIGTGVATGETLKSGLELGSKGAGMVGSTVEFIMTMAYKEELEKAKQKIAETTEAVAHAQKLDAELSLTGSTLTMSGQLDELTALMGEWSLALQNRKDYLAQLGSAADRASGNKAGGDVSQYLAYVSQAAESQSYLEAARNAVVTSGGVMKTQIDAMAQHRNYAYVADEYGVWDDRARKVDGEGPDLAQLRAAYGWLTTFADSAASELLGLAGVMGAMPEAT